MTKAPQLLAGANHALRLAGSRETEEEFEAMLSAEGQQAQGAAR
jgi:hypothetical protein